MRRRKRLAASGVLGGMVMLMVASLASPALAEVIEGPCTGSAEFSNNVTVTERTKIVDVVEVPEEDTVLYEGQIPIPPAEEPEPFSGNVSVALPAGGSWVVVEWPVPTGETVEVGASGLYEYEVPGFVPRGTGGVLVTATHTQRGITCVVAVTLSVEGSPGAPAIIGAVGTGVFALGVGAAGMRRRLA